MLGDGLEADLRSYFGHHLGDFPSLNIDVCNQVACGAFVKVVDVVALTHDFEPGEEYVGPFFSIQKGHEPG